MRPVKRYPLNLAVVMPSAARHAEWRPLPFLREESLS